jgi:hypothetical protein
MEESFIIKSTDQSKSSDVAFNTGDISKTKLITLPANINIYHGSNQKIHLTQMI